MSTRSRSSSNLASPGAAADVDLDLRAGAHRGRVPQLELDWDRCLDATFEGEIDAAGIWTGEPDRDAHLRHADFLDVDNHPRIGFSGRFTERTAETAFKGEVELTIRGVTRTVPLDIH